MSSNDHEVLNVLAYVLMLVPTMPEKTRPKNQVLCFLWKGNKP